MLNPHSPSQATQATQNNTMTTNTHGGARPGNGRKPLPPHLKVHRRDIYLTDPEWADLQARTAKLLHANVGRFVASFMKLSTKE